MKKILPFLFSFFIVQFAMAQQSGGKSMGNYLSYHKNSQSIIFRTTHGSAQVIIFSPTLFKISVWENQEKELPSYAVVGKPRKTKFSFTENKKTFWVKTDSLTLVINKYPLRFIFQTPDGKIINRDDETAAFWLNHHTFIFKHLFPKEIFTGLGEKTGPLNRRGSAYTNWNTDNPHYENWSDPLYSSIPFYMGRHNGLQYGIFVDNTSKSTFNFGAGNNRFSYFSVEGNRVDYYFFYHHSPAGILKEYSYLTGRMKLPPIWALGFQQSRWSYTPDKEVMEIATAFRDKKIPLDVLYLDIGYMNAYKDFTWSPTAFPHPGKLIHDLRNMGIHTVVIVDPGIKIEKGYRVYEEGKKNNYFLKYPDGKNYSGQVWPGWCNFPDFTNPKVRIWWGRQFQGLVHVGVSGFWNDMNEFSVWGKNVPPILHMDWEGKGTSYMTGKNAYGLEMARATYEGVRKLMNNRRPLVLTRAGFAGLQRYSAIWTGDNQATDEHMLLGIRLVNSFGLSGVPFAGYDVGGFGGNATAALYARWVSIGAFVPFFRVHSAISTKRSEPWSYGIAAQKLATRFIRLRYHLLPYLYAVFYEATQTGMPVQRSLSIDYPSDPKIYYRKFDNEYMFGPAFLIVPAKSRQMSVDAYLPKGKWYSFYNDNVRYGSKEVLTPSPLAQLPVFVKAGAIIPVQKLIQNTEENPGDTLEIHVYQGGQGNHFLLYEDDGNTFNYEKGAFYKRNIVYDPVHRKIILEKPVGKYVPGFKFYRIVFHGFQNEMKSIRINGKPVKLQINQAGLFLRSYQQSDKKLLSATIANRPQQIILKW